MLNYNMARTWSIDDPVVGKLVPIVQRYHFAMVYLAIFTFLFVNILL